MSSTGQIQWIRKPTRTWGRIKENAFTEKILKYLKNTTFTKKNQSQHFY